MSSPWQTPDSPSRLLPSSRPVLPENWPLISTEIPTYMAVVKDTFEDKPEVFNWFVAIMRDYNHQNIDTLDLIRRASRLFYGKPTLTEGLNGFLPVGYRIDVYARDPTFVIITIPQVTATGVHIFRMEPLRGTMYPLGSHSIPSHAGHIPLQLDPTPDINIRDRDSGHLSNASSSSKRKQMAMLPGLPRPVKKRKRQTMPDVENQREEALLDMLLDIPSSEPGHGVDISINNVVQQVTDTLSKSNIHEQLFRLSVEEAQCTLDFLQDLLDGSSLSTISKHIILKTSLKLTRIHDCVPRCLMLKGFKKTGDYPFALGHFGELWRGQVEGTEVAVKQARIFTSDYNVHKVPQKVRREAIIWRQCDHPNVLPFYGIYRDPAPSTYCLVSPFMVNGSLRQYIHRTVHPKRLDLVLDITCGLNYLHKMSIVHGDLKGDNILITDDYRAVITDFGISFVMGTTTFATSSSSSRRGGTLRWQAPEVLKGGPNSFPADIYSLTCVYFEVFDGTIPWSGLNDGTVTLNVIVQKEHLPRPKNLESTGHAELWWDVMTKCWAYEPQDRPTLPDIMASLHIIESGPMTESKWDRSILTRLHDPLIQIPSGLPRLFDFEGIALV